MAIIMTLWIVNTYLLSSGELLNPYLHNEGVVPMLIFDLVYTSPSFNALLSSFWMNIDDNPNPFQMAENGNISIDSQ